MTLSPETMLATAKLQIELLKTQLADERRRANMLQQQLDDMRRAERLVDQAKSAAVPALRGGREAA